MSKSAFRSFLLLTALSLPCVIAAAASAGVISPYNTEDAHAQQLWELDLTAPGDTTSETAPTGNFNLSPKPVQFSCTSTREESNTSVAFFDETLLLGKDAGLLKELQNDERTPPAAESSVPTEVLNLPIPEPGSLAIWILLGLSAGFLIRRKAKA